MSHLGARVLRMLKEDSPYELRDMEGNPFSKDEARRLLLSKYHVSEDILARRKESKQKTLQVKLKHNWKTRELDRTKSAE